MEKDNLIIDVHNLRKNFKDWLAVSNISLQVNRGEIFGFLGPNGSGKTTTIRMLCGLLTPDSGSGTCLGYDILKESNAIKRHTGYIPQYFGLYKKLSVYENLMFIAGLYGISNRRTKVDAIIGQLDLIPFRNQVSGTLSGGWKQRLSLASALLPGPSLLLLDEPTASVDPKSRRDFWELMHNLSAEGMTILLSSHNMEEVACCHRIAYVYNGRFIMSGKIQEIVDKVNLTTWLVKGSNLIVLSRQLLATPGIEQVMTFFDTLRVSGEDKAALEQGIAPYLNHPNYTWSLAKTTLEDVFVWLSTQQHNPDL
jgi:ABC-2 type transport system ATP-binding protein